MSRRLERRGPPEPAAATACTGLRTRPSAGRGPLPDEIASLAGYLDARRDATVPLCVCAGIVTRPGLTVVLAVDPRRESTAVAAAVAATLADPDGDLGPEQRVLGQPLDRSDVFAVVHRVVGVVGVTSLDLPGASGELGRPAPCATSCWRPPPTRSSRERRHERDAPSPGGCRGRCGRPADIDGAPRLLDPAAGRVDRQQELLAADIDQLWDDLFIESCADWAVPYIGALVGLPPDAERLEVAYAVALRRRKGTPAALEDFAEVVTGLVAAGAGGLAGDDVGAAAGHPPPLRVASMSLADGSRFRIGTPFDVSDTASPHRVHTTRAATAVVWPWQVSTFRALEAAPLPDPRRFALHRWRLRHRST